MDEDSTRLPMMGQPKTPRKRDFNKQSASLRHRIYAIWTLAWIPLLMTCEFIALLLSAFVVMLIMYIKADMSVNVPYLIDPTIPGNQKSAFYLILTIALSVSAIVSIIVLMAVSHYAPRRMIDGIEETCVRIDDGAVYDVLEGVCVSAGLKTTPVLYATPSVCPNAYTMGSAGAPIIVVTSELLKVTSRASLEAVLSHEVGHILNEDFSDMTNLHALVDWMDRFLRSMMNLSSPLRALRTSRSIVYFVVSLAVFIPAAFIRISSKPMTWLALRTMSKSRESLADATAVRLTRNPDAMAKALVEVHYGMLQSGASMMALQDLTSNKFMQSIGFDVAYEGSSTHPSFKKRMRDLVSMGASDAWLAYVKK